VIWRCYANHRDINCVLMNAIPLIVMACVMLAAFIALYLSERQRANAVRALANRSGLHYLGNALPRSLTLGGTPFQSASKVWNVIDGEPRGVRVIAFDCRVGVGKGSWRRTVIATESGADLSDAVPFNPDMMVESAGKWKILYRPKGSVNFRIAGLMPIAELEAHLNSVRAKAVND
jgi:hypothetical protein